MKRSAPAVQVLVSRFEFWIRGVAVVILISVVSWMAWLFSIAGAGRNFTEMTVVSAVSILALTLALLSLRCQATSLRWDGQGWYAGPIDRVGSEPWAVQVAVRIDLGQWMLLQLRSDQIDLPRERAWLPVQRLGMESQWHGLRCALFAARGNAAIDGAYRANSV